MFDAKSLLEQLLGPQNAATAQGYLDQGGKAVENLVGAETLAKGKDLFGQGLASLEQTASGLVGADRIAQAKDFATRNADGLTVGAIAGGLLGLLVGTRTGRNVGGAALKLGSLAALGGLAYKAYQSHQANQAATVRDPEQVTHESAPSLDPVTEQKLAAATIIAMVQAAKADGHVDETERAVILGRIGPVEGAAKAFLEAELAGPIDIDRVAALATTKEEAVHLYAASLLAIDPDQPSEKAYLKTLAEKLGLDDGLVAEIAAHVKDA